MNLKLNKDLVMAGVFIAGTSLYLSRALLLPVPFATGEPGPAFYPLVIVAVMYAASLKLLVGGLKKPREIIFQGDKRQLKPLLTVAATGLYISLFSVLGYWLCTWIYSFLVSLLFEAGKRRPGRLLLFSAAVATGVAIVGWLFFERLFDLHLPPGVWE